MMKQNENLLGAAGEHLVLSRLLSRGLSATQARRGSRTAEGPIPGVFSSPAVTIGYSSYGVKYECKSSATDSRNRGRQRAGLSQCRRVGLEWEFL